MRQSKKLLALVLSLCLLLTIPAYAAERDESNGDRLYALGLFKGTGNGYALDQTATRLQGLIMLTRLLGEEEAALACTDPCPFTDVAAGNPSRYVAYAYGKGYTTGTSATTFSPGNTIGFKHYVTFLLRALGYREQDGAFTFATSLDKAAELGMIAPSSAEQIQSQNAKFFRGDLVDLSIAALTTKLKDGSGTLAESLVQRGVFTRDEGLAQKVLDCDQATYTYVPTVPEPKPVQPPVPTPSAGVSRKTGSYSLPSGKVSADVITVDPSVDGVKIRTAMVDSTLGATAKFQDIVNASSAKVIVNGNFFESYKSFQIPIGHVMADGQFLYGVSGLSAMGFTEDGQIRVGRPAPFFFVEGNGVSWACYECNSGGQGPDTSVLYTPAYGQKVSLKCQGVVTVVTDGMIQSSQLLPAGSEVVIPRNGYVMFFGTAFAATNYYRSPEVGMMVSMEPRLTREDHNGFTLDGMVSILSGSPRLVEGGAACTTLDPGFQEARFTTAVTPRTAVGKTADGKLVIVSTGAASIQQLRELMLQLNCVDALNLDGGASTALSYDGKIIRNPGRALTTTLQIFA